MKISVAIMFYKLVFGQFSFCENYDKEDSKYKL